MGGNTHSAVIAYTTAPLSLFLHDVHCIANVADLHGSQASRSLGRDCRLAR